MKAIETHYVGPSNVRGPRIIATDSDNNRVIISYDHSKSGEDGHWEAARALCKKMNWTGEMVAGATKRGYVFVFLEPWTKHYQVRDTQPKTGALCSCKRGVQRDNCPSCEGTGMIIDFAAIRAANRVAG